MQKETTIAPAVVYVTVDIGKNVHWYAARSYPFSWDGKKTENWVSYYQSQKMHGGSTARHKSLTTFVW
ncbi:MAG: hypothetical protein ACE5GO_09230 [Anaerolineales bacterium]